MNDQLVAETTIKKKEGKKTSAGFEPEIPPTEELRIYPLNRAATGASCWVRAYFAFLPSERIMASLQRPTG